jgi:hypothetical protein
MSRFIKLTNMILNTRYIHKILIEPNKYNIHIVTTDINGFHWTIGACGLGNISTNSYNIQVCETSQPIDYKIVTDWISKIGV